MYVYIVQQGVFGTYLLGTTVQYHYADLLVLKYDFHCIGVQAYRLTCL